jgi:hypothetical protein
MFLARLLADDLRSPQNDILAEETPKQPEQRRLRRHIVENVILRRERLPFFLQGRRLPIVVEDAPALGRR